MIEVIKFLKENWAMITFFAGEIGALFVFVHSIHRGTKCSLRNDILDIYDKCKEKNQITKYQLETVCLSFEEYKKLKGNSFVETIVEEMKEFKIVD